MLPKPGDKLMLEDAYYKMHASCGHTHSALDALQALMADEHVSFDQVESAQVQVYRTAEKLCAALNTETETKAKFSLPYCVACMLRFGQVTLAEFGDSVMTDPEVLSLAKRVQVQENPDFTREYPVLRTEKVILHMKDGRTLSRQVDLPVGRPPYAFIEKKFFSLAGMAVSSDAAARIRETVLNLQLSDTLDTLGGLIRPLE